MIEKFESILLTTVFVNFLVCYGQDITESPTSTLKGATQIELATTYESFKKGNIKNIGYTVGSLLALYGISDNTEIRFGTDLRQEYQLINKTRGDDIVSGYTPFMLGVGADVIAEKGIWPQVTLIGDVFFPRTGGNDFKQDNLGFSLRTGFFHNLGKNQNAQLNYNLGADFGNDDLTYVYAITYLQNIGTIGGAYFEVNGSLPDGSSPDHYASVAFYWIPIPSIQFDTIVGRGINANQDFYITGRLQIYIPKNKIKTID